MSPETIWNVQTRVSPHDCDPHLRWKPAALFLALLKAASDHAASLGFDFESMSTGGSAFVLSRFHIHFQAAAQMDEDVTIQTWPKGIQQRLFFTRDFILTGQGGRPLGLATSAWLLIDPRSRRLLLPQTLAGRLPANPGRSALDLELEKIGPPDHLPEAGRYQAGYSAVDVLGHANSARYLEWLSDALGPQLFAGRQLDWLQLNFVHETRPGDQIALRLGPDPEPSAAGRWLAAGENLTTRQRGFEAAFAWQSGAAE